MSPRDRATVRQLRAAVGVGIGYAFLVGVLVGVLVGMLLSQAVP